MQIAVAVLSWALFGYYWWLVSLRRITPETLRALQILLVLVALIWAATALWIQHNRRRFGGRPDRRTRRDSRLELSRNDSLGRPIVVVGGEDLRVAPYVEISIDPESGHKRFEPHAHAPAELEERSEEDDHRVGGAA